jgi:hypothetical protein
MLGGKYRTALISRSARLVDASVTVLSAETDGVEALQIARFELAGSTGARGSIASGSSVASWGFCLAAHDEVPARSVHCGFIYSRIQSTVNSRAP